MPHTGHGFGHLKAIGLGQIDMRTKAQFQHEQGMIEQVGAPARGGEQVFADPDQRRFEIGTRRMGGATRAAWARRINGAPVKEGEAGTVALHHWVGVTHLLQGGRVKWSHTRYDSSHEGCSSQSRMKWILLLCRGAGLCVKCLLSLFACF